MAKEQQRSRRRRRQQENIRESVRSFSEEVPGSELSEDYALEQAIAELPESYREVILLRYYGGQSCRQVAEQLDMPLGTVTKTLSRAYAMLRESLRGQKADEDCEVQR